MAVPCSRTCFHRVPRFERLHFNHLDNPFGFRRFGFFWDFSGTLHGLKAMHMLRFLGARALLEWWCISVLKWLYRFSALYKYNFNIFNLKNNNDTVASCSDIDNIIQQQIQDYILGSWFRGESVLYTHLNAKPKARWRTQVFWPPVSVPNFLLNSWQ